MEALVCSSCKAGTVHIRCNCCDPAPFFCYSCFSSHIVDATDLSLHQVSQIENYGTIQRAYQTLRLSVNDFIRKKMLAWANQFDDHYLYNVVPNTRGICKYGIGEMSKQYITVNSPVEFSDIASYVWYKGNLYYTGGVDTSTQRTVNDSFVINVSNWNITPWQGMQQARATHATVLYDNELFVFGGYGDWQMTFGLSTCERYRNGRWHVFKLVDERPWCSAAVVGDKIYLTSTDTSVDEFDPATQQCTRLELQLAVGTKKLFSWFEYLFVIEANTLHKIDITEEINEQQEIETPENLWTPWSAIYESVGFVLYNNSKLYILAFYEEKVTTQVIP